MSLKLEVGRSVSEETRRVAKAAFPKGNVYLWIGDELGELYSDHLFIDLYPVRGQPTVSPGRLALITVMQFMEGLTDRQAAEAVRGRIDWKYALGLELTDSGFDFSVLSEFRQRLIEGQKEQFLLDVLLEELKKRGWLKTRSKQRTDSTHVVASVRQLNRLEMVGETMSWRQQTRSGSRRSFRQNGLRAMGRAWMASVCPKSARNAKD
jgi:transposase